MADVPEYDPDLTEQLLQEGDQLLSESRRVLRDLDAALDDDDTAR
jgi:hypothetical protein